MLKTICSSLDNCEITCNSLCFLASELTTAWTTEKRKFIPPNYVLIFYYYYLSLYYFFHYSLEPENRIWGKGKLMNSGCEWKVNIVCTKNWPHSSFEGTFLAHYSDIYALGRQIRYLARNNLIIGVLIMICMNVSILEDINLRWFNH